MQKKKNLQSRMGGGVEAKETQPSRSSRWGPRACGFGDSPLSGPCAQCTRLGSAGPCWSEPTQMLPTPAPTIIITGLGACSHCGAEDKVSSQVTEVKRVPALALP